MNGEGREQAKFAIGRARDARRRRPINQGVLLEVCKLQMDYSLGLVDCKAKASGFNQK